MGIVTQDTQMFATTIEANIAYGLEHYTRADLEEAAKAAHVHSFVSSFPEGYSTRVGERGVQLSGGQRQRIALARLLIRKPKAGSRPPRSLLPCRDVTRRDGGRPMAVMIIAKRWGGSWGNNDDINRDGGVGV